MLHITPPERVVLQLLADGRTNREIADRLRVDESAVEVYLTELFRRMGGTSRADAVAAAFRRGLVVTGRN